LKDPVSFTPNAQDILGADRDPIHTSQTKIWIDIGKFTRVFLPEHLPFADLGRGPNTFFTAGWIAGLEINGNSRLGHDLPPSAHPPFDPNLLPTQPLASSLPDELSRRYILFELLDLILELFDPQQNFKHL